MFECNNKKGTSSLLFIVFQVSTVPSYERSFLLLSDYPLSGSEISFLKNFAKVIHLILVNEVLKLLVDHYCTVAISD